VLGTQALAVIAIAAFAISATFVRAWRLDPALGFRAEPEDEMGGLDIAQHVHSAYEFGVGSGVGMLSGTHPGHREMS
jgi:Amt family ammonium transporter